MRSVDGDTAAGGFKTFMSENLDPYHDLPIPEAIQQAEDLKAQGLIVIFKFTCQHCGQRLFFDEPFTIYAEASCDKCGKITKVKKVGYAVVGILGAPRK